MDKPANRGKSPARVVLFSVLAVVVAAGIAVALCFLFAFDPVRTAKVELNAAADRAAFNTIYDEDRIFEMKADYADMDEREQKAYKRIYAAAMLGRDSVMFSGEDADPDWLYDVYQRIFYDSPELFFLEDSLAFDYRIVHGGVADSKFCTAIFEYRDDVGDIENTRARLREVVSDMTSSLDDDMTASEKAVAINQMVTDAAEYDASEEAMTNNDNASHTVVGTLLNGRAVCEGYAMTYALACRAAGLQCRVILGNVPESIADVTVAHAWNAVLTEDGWRYVDPTYNRNYRNRDKCLLADEDEMVEDGYVPYENNITD